MANSLRVFIRQLAPPSRRGGKHFLATARLPAPGDGKTSAARDRLPPLLVREIARAEDATAEGQCLHLRVAVDYSSRDAIARAVAGVTTALPLDLFSADLVGRVLAQALTAESGEVDLLIRTGGEKRLSDFLLWESAYAELLFTDRMWPDFDATDLEAALREFNRRERRFGSISEAATNSALSGTGGER